jgi:sugar/nucleoside kinase (ribokinase family)
MKKIWSYGISNFDIVTQTIQQWPDPGGLIVTEKTEFMLGGPAINTAITLRKIGYEEVGLIARLGDDLIGRLLLGELDKNGVDIRSVSIGKDKNTAVCIVCVHPGGERSLLYTFGENNSLGVENADISLVAKGDFFHLGAAMGMAKSRADLIIPLLDQLKQKQVSITADTSFDPMGIWWESLAPCLPFVDFLFSNESEARLLTGKSNPLEAARHFRENGAKTAVVKLGGEGAYILSDSWSGLIPPFKVNVVDTTGAGDSYCGGFLYGMSKGWSVEQSAVFANAVGALCVSAFGATTGIRSYAETVAFIRKQGRSGAWEW